MARFNQFADQAARNNFNLPTLRFQKTGGEIADALKDANLDRVKRVEGLLVDVARICKDRDVTMEEFLDDKTDATTGQFSYEAKIGSSMATVRSNAALKALEDDLQTLRSARNTIKYLEAEIEEADKLADNIETARVFDLTYSELLALGF